MIENALDTIATGLLPAALDKVTRPKPKPDHPGIRQIVQRTSGGWEQPRPAA